MATAIAIATPASKGKAKAKNPTIIKRMAHQVGNDAPVPNTLLGDVTIVSAP
jgi:hypothetical protein